MRKLKIMVSALKNFVSHLRRKLENVLMESIKTETQRKKAIRENIKIICGTILISLSCNWSLRRTRKLLIEQLDRKFIRIYKF